MTLPVSPAGKFVVFIENAVAGEYHCLSIQVPSGGSRAHTAQLEKLGEVYEYEPGQDALRTLVGYDPEIFNDDDRILDYLDNQECAIYFYPFDYDEILEPRVLVHWGRICAGNPKLQGNQLLITSRTDGHLIGSMVDKTWFHFGNDGEESFEIPIVFNPVVDGVIVGNHSQRPNQDVGNDTKQYFWHPDEDWLDVLDGPGYNNAYRPIQWTLPAAVDYLIQALGNSYWLDIPELADIEAMFTDPPVPTDVKIPRGIYLPEALERLLGPYGYSFKFEPLDEGDETSPDRKHKFFAWRRDRGLPPHNGTGMTPGGGGGSGVDVAITLEQLKATDRTRSDIDDCEFDVDLINKSASKIIALGDPLRVEGTFELVPGWVKERETTDPLETSKSHISNVGREQARVWRDYVLNETGFYTKGRRGGGAPDQAEFDAEEFFGSPQTKRARKFLPTLALDALGNPMGSNKGVTVQIYNGATWVDFDHPFDILQNECGIRITTNKLGWDLMKVNRIRITATIESDERLRIESETLQNKIAGTDSRPVLIDTKNRYRKYELKDSGTHKSINYDAVTGGDPSDQVDQTDELQTLVDRLSDAYQKTAFSGKFLLVDQKWYGNDLVGRRVEKINQREVDMNSDTESNDDDKSYPIITAVTMDIQEQKTILFLDSFTG